MMENTMDIIMVYRGNISFILGLDSNNGKENRNQHSISIAEDGAQVGVSTEKSLQNTKNSRFIRGTR